MQAAASGVFRIQGRIQGLPVGPSSSSTPRRDLVPRESTIKPPKMKIEPTIHAQNFCSKGNWAATRFARTPRTGRWVPRTFSRTTRGSLCQERDLLGRVIHLSEDAAPGAGTMVSARGENRDVMTRYVRRRLA